MIEEEAKWELEAKYKLARHIFTEPKSSISFESAFVTGYLQACRKRQEEIERLKEGLTHAPFSSYGEALQEGCDSDGAWECFKEDYRRHIGILLKEIK